MHRLDVMAAAPDTVLVAVPHRGLRFDLARKLLSRGFFATLMTDGECAARAMGNATRLIKAPVALVVQCRTTLGTRRLLRAVGRAGWDPRTIVLIAPPGEVRIEARKVGARIVDDPTDVDPICDHIMETLAA